MLKSITAMQRNPSTNIIEEMIQFTYDGSSPFIVKDARGLGPVKGEISDVVNALDPGSLYLSTRIPKRNIVLDIEFKPGGVGIDTLRYQLYSLFMTGAEVELAFDTTTYGEVWTKGTVESHEAVIFTKSPTVQISIICPQAYFRGHGLRGEHVVEAGDYPTFEVPYDGKVPVGFQFEGVLSADVDSPLLKAVPEDPNRRMGLNMKALKGDTIQISSIQGDRYARYIRNGNRVNALGYFFGSLVGMKLQPGINYFLLKDYGNFSSVKISYEKMYGGI